VAKYKKSQPQCKNYLDFAVKVENPVFFYETAIFFLTFAATKNKKKILVQFDFFAGIL